MGESVMSASFIRSGWSLFGESAGGFAEVLGEMQLGEVHLQQHLACEALEMPAPRAYRRAHAERRILRHLRGELACCFHVLAGGCDALDHARRMRLLGGEEAAGEGDVGAECAGTAEVEQRPVFRAG